MVMIGHRGCKDKCVQNTREAFLIGAARGYAMLECDVQVSKDGVYYVCHDNTFLPYLFTDAKLYGQSHFAYSWAELAQLELHQDHKYFGRLISLADYLALCKEQGVGALIELKATLGINNEDLSNLPGLVELVKAAGMAENTILLTAIKPALAYLKKHHPEFKLQYLTLKNTTNMASVRYCIENGFDMDACAWKIRRRHVKAMHKAGLKVNTWTVNFRLQALRLRLIGVDMITTNVLKVENK